MSTAHGSYLSSTTSPTSPRRSSARPLKRRRCSPSTASAISSRPCSRAAKATGSRCSTASSSHIRSGIFYTAITQYLGFLGFGDEYKVMGLAAYGEPRFATALGTIVRPAKDGTFRLDLRYFRHLRDGVQMTWEDGAPELGVLFTPALEQLLGPRRQPSDELEQRHSRPRGVAAAGLRGTLLRPRAARAVAVRQPQAGARRRLRAQLARQRQALRAHRRRGAVHPGRGRRRRHLARRRALCAPRRLRAAALRLRDGSQRLGPGLRRCGRARRRGSGAAGIAAAGTASMAR